jgi:hypothetical protein
MFNTSMTQYEYSDESDKRIMEPDEVNIHNPSNSQTNEIGT